MSCPRRVFDASRTSTRVSVSRRTQALQRRTLCSRRHFQNDLTLLFPELSSVQVSPVFQGQPSVWTRTDNCSLAPVYVHPEKRRSGAPPLNKQSPKKLSMTHETLLSSLKNEGRCYVVAKRVLDPSSAFLERETLFSIPRGLCKLIHRDVFRSCFKRRPRLSQSTSVHRDGNLFNSASLSQAPFDSRNFLSSRSLSSFSTPRSSPRIPGKSSYSSSAFSRVFPMKSSLVSSFAFSYKQLFSRMPTSLFTSSSSCVFFPPAFSSPPYLISCASFFSSLCLSTPPRFSSSSSSSYSIHPSSTSSSLLPFFPRTPSPSESTFALHSSSSAHSPLPSPSISTLSSSSSPSTSSPPSSSNRHPLISWLSSSRHSSSSSFSLQLSSFSSSSSFPLSSVAASSPTPSFSKLRVCIVGAGPAGFYCAKYLQKVASDRRPLQIDMIELLPSPYGLVRYGVAPDHPEVKHVTHDFDEVASHPCFRFFGNVSFGRDVSLQELRLRYDAVILAYGTACDRPLRIEGADELQGCISAKDFVGFYNAHPHAIPRVKSRLPSLSEQLEEASSSSSPKTATIIGNGNVALDVARMLVKSRERLGKTDISTPALAWISQANFRSVEILGRRGWVQASFTNKELRELLTDDEILTIVDPKDFADSLNDPSLEELSNSRLKQRSRGLFEQMLENWELREKTDRRIVHLRFLTSPIRALPHPVYSSRVGMLEVARNLLEGRAGRQKAVMLLPDDKEGEGEDKSLAQREKGMKYEQIPTSLLIWSIGLMSVHPDPDLSPFIKQGTGEFLNENGRIEPPRMISWNEDNSSSSSSPSSSSSLGRRLGGLYASGWVRRGAHGVIASNIMDARETVVQLLTDLDHFSHDLSSSSSSTLSPLGLDKDIAVGSGAVVGEGRERAPLFLRHSPVASPHSTPSMSRQSMGSSFSSSPPEKNPLSSSSSCNRGFDQPKDRSLDVLLESRGVRTVSFSDWRKIEKVEKERGEKEGKVAEKIDSVEEMLSIVERQS